MDVTFLPLSSVAGSSRLIENLLLLRITEGSLGFGGTEARVTTLICENSGCIV